MDSLTLTIDPREAVFLAGGAVLMLRKRAASEGGLPDRFTHLLGLSLLNRLCDLSADLTDTEIKEILRAAVDSAMMITGEETFYHESSDGITASDAEKFM